MVISLKDAFKLAGVTIISFCAVFVCTFFISYYMDAAAIADKITDPQAQALYDAQMALRRVFGIDSRGYACVLYKFVYPQERVRLGAF